LLLKTLNHLIYRKLLTSAKQLPKDQRIPSLRNSVYRIKNIPEDSLKKFIQWLAEKEINM
ncbi:MAG: hypothetical protein ACK4F9_01715, partial [Brevinematia bacterium]